MPTEDRRKSCFTCEGAPLDRYVTEYVMEMLTAGDAQEKFSAASQPDPKIDVSEIRQKINATETRKADLADAVGRGELELHEFRRMRDSANDVIRRLEEQLSAALPAGPVRDLVAADDVRAQWKDWDVERRRQLIGQLLDIQIFPPGTKERARVQLPGGGWIAHPNSIQITPKLWRGR